MLARSGRPDSAEPLFGEALGILEAVPGDQRSEIAISKFGLGLVEHRQGTDDRAEPLFREALELRRALHGNEHIDVAVTLEHLGTLYLDAGRYDSAEAMLKESVAIRRKLFGERHPEVAQSLGDQAIAAFEGRKDYSAADSLWREALAIWEGIYGRNHRQVGLVLGSLGRLELDRGDADSALKLFAAGRRVMRAVSGDESTDVAGMDRLVGEALYRRGDLGGAQPELERAVELSRKLQGPSHLDLATAELSLAQVVRDRGDYGRADSLYTHALGIWREAGGEEDGIAVGLDGHARLRLLQGRAAEADSMLRESLAIARKHHPDSDERVAQARIDLGAALLAQGRMQEAESLLVESYLRLSPYERPRGRAILAALFDRMGRREPPTGYRITTAGGQPADTAR
jgi:tetratricopeptide (TPR) repeat protein